MKLKVRTDSDDGDSKEMELADGASVEVDNPCDLQIIDHDSVSMIIPTGDHLMIVGKDGTSITLKNARAGNHQPVSLDPNSGLLVFAESPSS